MRLLKMNAEASLVPAMGVYRSVAKNVRSRVALITPALVTTKIKCDLCEGEFRTDQKLLGHSNVGHTATGEPCVFHQRCLTQWWLSPVGSPEKCPTCGLLNIIGNPERGVWRNYRVEE